MMKFQKLSDLLDTLNSLDTPDSLPKLPEPIRKELERILKLEGEPYGLVFAVRDLYETVLKVISKVTSPSFKGAVVHVQVT